MNKVIEWKHLDGSCGKYEYASFNMVDDWFEIETEHNGIYRNHHCDMEYVREVLFVTSNDKIGYYYFIKDEEYLKSPEPENEIVKILSDEIFKEIEAEHLALWEANKDDIINYLTGERNENKKRVRK